MKLKLFTILLFFCATSLPRALVKDIEQLKKEFESKTKIRVADIGRLPLSILPQSIIKDIEIEDVVIEEEVPGFEKGFIVRGKATLKGNIETEVRLVIVDFERERGISLGLFFPSFLKLLQLIPQLSFMKDFALLDPKLMLSSFDYQDEQLYTYVADGLNIIAAVEFKGPFNWLATLIKNKAKLKDAFVFEAEQDIVLTGYIDKKFSESYFNIDVPIRLGLDLTKIKGVPESISSVIQKITSSDLTVGLKPPPDSLISLGTGIIVTLGTQERKLTAEMHGAISDQTSYVRGFFTEIDFKWIALENVAFQINWDSNAMPAAIAIGLPFTGLELEGTLALGTNKEDGKRAAITLAGKASLEGDVLSGLVFLGQAKNIGVSTFIHYIAERIGKPLTQKELPEITFKNLKMYFAAKDTWVALVNYYQEGIEMKGEITFWDKDGELTLGFYPTRFVVEGIGYLQNIDAKIFKITGAGLDEKAGTADDGPVIKIIASATTPDRSGIFIDGQFEIPALKISQNTHFQADVDGMRANFQTKIDDLFTSDFNAYIGKNFDDLLLEYTFQQDFIDYLADQMQEGITRLKNDAKEKLKKVNNDLQKARNELKKAQSGVSYKVAQEITYTDEKIEVLEREIDDLKLQERSTCRGVNAIVHAGECIGISSNITKKGIELVGLKTYRATLKPGQKLIIGVIGSAEKITEAVEKAELAHKLTLGSIAILEDLLNNFAQGTRLFQLKKAYGKISGKDLKEGKLATFSLDFEINIPQLKVEERLVLENVAIDFKDAGKSIKKIADKAIQQLKQRLHL